MKPANMARELGRSGGLASAKALTAAERRQKARAAALAPLGGPPRYTSPQDGHRGETPSGSSPATDPALVF